MKKQGASVVISHHILQGKEELYEAWLNEIDPVCKSYSGYIDRQIIRPIPNVTFIYTVIIRFDAIENLKKWMDSQDRKLLINKVKPLFAKDDNYIINSGLDFLFVPENGNSKTPVRWKQYLITWSAIYPLALLVPFMVSPVLRSLNIPNNRFLDTFFVSGLIVLFMIYLIMPYYTRLIRKWLYN